MTHARPARTLLVACLLTLGALQLAAPPAAASELRDATRLGAFSGAMRFCEERYGGNERRYRLARLRVASEVDGMERREKIRALAARDRAHERGQFFGNALDDRECRALLRASEWRAWVN